MPDDSRPKPPRSATPAEPASPLVPVTLLTGDGGGAPPDDPDPLYDFAEVRAFVMKAYNEPGLIGQLRTTARQAVAVTGIWRWGWDRHELLNDAVERALRRRRIRRVFAILEGLQGIVWSVAKTVQRQARRRDEHRETGWDVEALAANEPGAEAQLAYRQLLSHVYDAFQDDPPALEVLSLSAVGTPPEEVQRTLNLSPVGYATIRRRIRRKLDAQFPNKLDT